MKASHTETHRQTDRKTLRNTNTCDEMMLVMVTSMESRGPTGCLSLSPFRLNVSLHPSPATITIIFVDIIAYRFWPPPQWPRASPSPLLAQYAHAHSETVHKLNYLFDLDSKIDDRSALASTCPAAPLLQHALYCYSSTAQCYCAQPHSIATTPLHSWTIYLPSHSYSK